MVHEALIVSTPRAASVPGKTAKLGCQGGSWGNLLRALRSQAGRGDKTQEHRRSYITEAGLNIFSKLPLL